MSKILKKEFLKYRPRARIYQRGYLETTKESIIKAKTQGPYCCYLPEVYVCKKIGNQFEHRDKGGW